MVPSTATTMPAKPHTRQPTRMAAFTAMAPARPGPGRQNPAFPLRSAISGCPQIALHKGDNYKPAAKGKRADIQRGQNSGHSLALSQRGAAARGPRCAGLRRGLCPGLAGALLCVQCFPPPSAARPCAGSRRMLCAPLGPPSSYHLHSHNKNTIILYSS